MTKRTGGGSVAVVDGGGGGGRVERGASGAVSGRAPWGPAVQALEACGEVAARVRRSTALGLAASIALEAEAGCERASASPTARRPRAATPAPRSLHARTAD